MAPECQISTDEQDPTEFVCRWLGCGENFGCLDELVSHLTSIHVTSQHGVFYCSWKGCIRAKGFNARYKMLIHIRTHTNERPFACPDCSKRFSRQENLRIHSRTHTGEKPYVCTVAGCSKAYSNSSDRFKHTRTHFVEKPYECRQPGCGKKYTDPSSLRKHVKIYGHARRPEELDSKKETFALDQSDINFIAKGKSNMQRNTNDTCINLMDTYSYDNGSTLSSNRDTKNDVNIEQMLTAVAAAVRLSPTPSTPTDLRISSSSSDPQVEFAQNLLKLASSRLSHTHNDWNTVSPVDSAEINAAAAWNVALQQYRAGLLFGADPKCMEHLGSSFIESTITQPHLNENQAQYKSFKPTINHPHTMEMSRSPSPLDLSLPSSKNRQDQ